MNFTLLNNAKDDQNYHIPVNKNIKYFVYMHTYITFIYSA